MQVTERELKLNYQALDTDSLIGLLSNGGLTDMAVALIKEVLADRNVEVKIEECPMELVPLIDDKHQDKKNVSCLAVVALCAVMFVININLGFKNFSRLLVIIAILFQFAWGFVVVSLYKKTNWPPFLGYGAFFGSIVFVLFLLIQDIWQLVPLGDEGRKLVLNMLTGHANPFLIVFDYLIFSKIWFKLSGLSPRTIKQTHK